MANKEKDDPQNLFRRLTRLFRSGPVVRRKVRGYDTSIAVADKTKSSGVLLFQKSMAPTYSTITQNAYNLSERLMRYNDYVEMQLCLAGDTKIAVPNGYKTIQELADECSVDPDKQFIVYAYDHNKAQIVPAFAKQARQTRVDNAWKVTFDNGQTLIGTFDHRLMRRDGTYCEIGNLRPGDTMMPFTRKNLYKSELGDTGDGYRWINTMDKKSSYRGWTTEHRLIAEWVAGRSLNADEVVHHINFVAYDNRPENLKIMLEIDHQRYHAEILNGKKWAPENREWIEKFKADHSKWMTENNPAARHDITFGRILETCENVDFNSVKLCAALDTSMFSIRARIRAHGFDSFETFARAYRPSWKNNGQDNTGTKNPRYDHGLTFDDVSVAFERNMTLKTLAQKLNTVPWKVTNRIKSAGFKSYTDFNENYTNHKVVSVEYHGCIPLFDLTVDGYKNFATDSVISHNTPEVSTACDIYADETCAADDRGRILHIYSDNEKVREVLEGLFYDTLNIEFSLRSWVRNLVTFGDVFVYNDVHPKYGVVSAFPIPVNEIEREENYDREDPFAVRFRWVTLGNRTLENWEVSHFRLLGQDTYLPYGSSLIEASRKVWRQLILLEDAMLVYRVVRAPERRVFYIDVGNTAPNDVDEYIEAQRRNLRSAQVVDKATGRVDLRYAPLNIEEDYFLPVRGGDTGTKIDTLAGGQNAAAIEDVAYLQKKLIAGLKIPRAYLGYDDMLSSKASLAQLDIRFSRTINVIQKTIIAELNKLAIIHLFAHGYRDDDLMDFTLRMSNPSTVAQQQKLELWRAKFEIGGSLPGGMGSRRFVQREVWGLNDKEIEDINNERIDEAALDTAVEAGGEGEGGGGEPGGGGGGGEADLFGGGEEPGGGEEQGGGTEKAPPEENAGEEPDVEPQQQLLTSVDDPEDDEDFVSRVRELDATGAKVQPQLKRALYNKSRKRTHGASSTFMPDLNKMTSAAEPGDETDSEWRDSVVSNPLSEARLTADLKSSLRRMERSSKFTEALATEKNVSGTKVLTEGTDVQDEIDALDINIDFVAEDAGAAVVGTLNERLARESELSRNDAEWDDE